MTAFVVDTFTDTNGTGIFSHTGETGATWTLIAAAGANDPTIQSNRLQGVDGTGYFYARASGTPPSADYYVEAPMYYAQAGGGFPGGVGEAIGVRTSGPTGGTYGYWFGWNDADVAWRLDCSKGGGTNALATNNADDVTRTTGETKTLKLVVSGSTTTNLKCYVDGVLVIEYDDSTSPITAAGNAGFFCVSFNHSFEYVSITGDVPPPPATSFQGDAFQGSALQQYGGVISGGSPDKTVALTGYAATSAYGALTPVVEVIPLGRSTTAVKGDFVLDLGITFLGRSATTVKGDVTPNTEIIPLGRGATTAKGDLVPAIDLALLGCSATTAKGDVGYDLSTVVTPTGRSATTAYGALTPNVETAILGRSATMAKGDLTPSTSTDASVALTGLASTTAQGALLGQAGLSGLAATLTPGALLRASENVLELLGRSATGTKGDVGISSGVTLTGLVATTAQGTLGYTVGGNISIALTGLAASSIQGVLYIELIRALTGLGSTMAKGDFGFERGAALVGWSTTGGVGSLKPELVIVFTGLRATTNIGGLVLGFDITGDVLLWVHTTAIELAVQTEVVTDFVFTEPEAKFVRIDPDEDTVLFELQEELA
jgi:hypothetical protein